MIKKKISSSTFTCFLGFHKEYIWKTHGQTKMVICATCNQRMKEIPILKMRTYHKAGYILEDRLYYRGGECVETTGIFPKKIL